MIITVNLFEQILRKLQKSFFFLFNCYKILTLKIQQISKNTLFTWVGGLLRKFKNKVKIKFVMNQIRRAQNFTSCLFVILKCWVMDKLQLTGWNLGRVFNFSCGHLHAAACFVSSVKLPNLELKTRPKQLLGSLPLVIVLPG